MRSYHGVVTVLTAIFFACLGWAVKEYAMPAPYDEKYAENIMEHSLTAYVNAGQQYERLCALTDCAVNSPQLFQTQLNFYKNSTPYTTASGQETLVYLDEMMKSGKVMPWSGKPMDQSACRELLTLYDTRKEEYNFFGAVLEFVMTDETARRLYSSQYPKLLKKLLEIDAQITSELFNIVCYQHMIGKYADDSVSAKAFNSLLRTVPKQNKHTSNNKSLNDSKLALTMLKGDRFACIAGSSGNTEPYLNACGALGMFRSSQNAKQNL